MTFFTLIGILISCAHDESINDFSAIEPQPVNKDSPSIKSQPLSVKDSLNQQNIRNIQDSVMASIGMVDISQLDSSIKVDIKYNTSDNFFKVQLYHYLDRAFFQRDVAERLVKSQQYLSKIDSNLYLLIYDAARPVSVQKKMWKALDSIPPRKRGRFVASGKNLSMHNLGVAVDITICDQMGNPLDMGAGFDDPREIAYPKYEERFLSNGQLSADQVENRKLLRKVMANQGFWNLTTEWWHFTYGTRKMNLEKYKPLLTEPGVKEL